MSKRTRQYIAIAAAVAAYCIVHEGAHLIDALLVGAFKQINYLGLGIQIDVCAERMTDAQLGRFCLAGAAATLAAGYTLAAFTGTICKAKGKLLRAVFYYVTITMLLLDPLYLSVLCGLFGGGDMNGIARLMPQSWARIAFGAVLLSNLVLLWKKVLPAYGMDVVILRRSSRH